MYLLCKLPVAVALAACDARLWTVNESDLYVAGLIVVCKNKNLITLTDKKLRLLFVVDSTFPTLGGAESQARKLAISLRERGHDVDFVAPQVLVDQSLVDEVDGFSVRRIPYPHIKTPSMYI